MDTINEEAVIAWRRFSVFVETADPPVVTGSANKYVGRVAAYQDVVARTCCPAKFDAGMQ
jgi:hypothetical protein